MNPHSTLSPGFCTSVYSLFKQGYDTSMIAQMMKLPERIIEKALHQAREAKRHAS